MKNFNLIRFLSIIFLAMTLTVQCTTKTSDDKSDKKGSAFEKGTFGYDAAFLAKYQEMITLQSDDGKARLLICPAYQSRVMTSTADGDSGMSFGWVNYNMIASGKLQQHINPFGGEDRIWVGPEGGQFSVFFKPGTRFVLDDWFTPVDIDAVDYKVVEADQKHAVFTHNAHMQNYSGTVFDFRIEREVDLLSDRKIGEILGIAPGTKTSTIGYQSKNKITNMGDYAWTHETGAISIWMLGMLVPSPTATIVMPYRTGDVKKLGPIVNDRYFGAISEDRMKISDGVIFLKADGKSRGKIGLSPSRALPFAGSYDEENAALTIINFTISDDVKDYVNSMWEIQDEPFKGDLVNAYNDGPVNGKALGPFYELESSSPAAFLKPGEIIEHTHITMHFTGPKDELNAISQTVLGVGLDEITSAF